MKLVKRAEIDAFLKGPPQTARAAVIYGKDRSQVLERAANLSRAIVPDINDPFNVAILTDSDVDADPARLEEELQALSMMGGKRLIRLKFFTEKAALEKAVAASLKAHAQGEFNPDAFLVIEAGALGGDSALRKVAEAEKAAAAIACYEDETGDIIRLAREALARDEVSLSTAAMDMFVQRLPKERGIAHQEIERLILFIGPGSRRTLDEKELQDFLGVEPDASLFKAALDAFSGRMKQAQAGLRRAFAEGEGGASAVRALSQHCQKLRTVKTAMSAGASVKEASRMAGIFWKEEDEYQRQARAWPFEALDKVSSDLIDTDRQCKSTGMPDLLLAERLFMQVAARAGRV